uniref:Anaphase-promoting complex subunit 1 n=2 Tax=Anthurium amnicola TaxID=1678845 RepID=A0A1D1Y4T9_9ARAE
MFRCALRRNPSSSLANDCITAMAEGLHSSFYNHFIVCLWGNSDSYYLSNADSHVDLEWESFKDVIIKICQKCGSSFQQIPCESNDTSWDFLINSEFHKKYRQHTAVNGFSFATILDTGVTDHSTGCINAGWSLGTSFYTQLLVGGLDALHALYESLKLDNLRKHDSAVLVDLLCHIAASLGESGYADHYIRDFPFVSLNIAAIHSSPSPRCPPSLFRWFERCLQCGCKPEHANDLPHMVSKDKGSAVSWARKIVAFYSLLLGAERNEQKLSSGVYCDIARGKARTAEELTVLAMVAERFNLQQLDLLPAGVSLPLRHALDKCRESPPTDWPATAYVLIGREDLAMGRLGFTRKHKEHGPRNNLNLISVCTPYMLPLQPVTIPSSISDITRFDGIKDEDVGSVDNSLEDGMEHMFNSSTKLRYGRDLRLNEVRRLLWSARPVAIQTPIHPSASDQELQQHQLWNVAQRTSALPFGRGAFTLATTYTLLTEALVVPKLVFSGRLPTQQNATVNLDPNIRNISELGSWPEFHNGVAASLTLAPFQGKMSRTWIQYNKPEEPNASHAGVLLGLGLHGHLCVLTITDVYRYLAQEHETTTVGVLLGMAASYRGTMHPEISKILYVHIPSRHPSTFPELELPTLMQSAALLAVGLLYEGSAHPLTMKILLGEIGRRSGGDNVLEREGYAVAAGSALGLVALGRGKDAPGFMESFVDRLYQYIGGKEAYYERTLNTGHMIDENNRSAGQMMDGTQINVDVTAPGATIALALIFMKTESEMIASRLSIPATHFDLQFVRPDFIMLRIIARNLIMWLSIQPSTEWVESQVPEIVKVGISIVTDEKADNGGFDAEALVQAYVNIIAGTCISLGLKFAGSRNGDAQELLYGYAVYFLNEIKPVCVTNSNSLPKGLSKYVDRGTLEICLHLIVLSLSVVMAGSGHLQTFRLLRFLRSRGSTDGHISYGIQMAVNLAIGFLFLGGGMQTFSTANSAIAALLITLYPRLPIGPNDNRCHVQAFRHLYVIATESRWVQTVDVDTGLPVYAPLEMTVVETENFAETSFCEISPCILPERAFLKTVRVCGPRYWPQVIHLTPEEKPWWLSGERNNPFDNGILYIKRKVGVCSYIDDPTGCQSLLSRAMHKVSDASHLSALAKSISNNGEPAEFKVDQLVGTFSADPSLIAFAQLCCDPTWTTRSDADFQEFCSQILLECVSKDRPALLQVYLSFYTQIGSMWEQVKSGCITFNDSLFLSSLKIAIAYNEAIIRGRLTCTRESRLTCTREGIIQATFIESLGKRVEEILNCSHKLKGNLRNYLEGHWLYKQDDKFGFALLSWHLQWFGIPPPYVAKSAVEKIKPKITGSLGVPLLRILLPTTHATALSDIGKMK